MPNFTATLEKLENRRYGVSNRRLMPRLSADVYLVALFKTSAMILQWRETDLEEEVNRLLIRKGAELARKSGRLFLVNSNAPLALQEGAHGVHLKARQKLAQVLALRERAPSDFWVGQSVHSLAEALRSEADGADYLILGPVFPPLSKPASLPPLGLAGLRRAASKVRIPIFAIGGIEESNTGDVLETGVAGIAGITWMHRELKNYP